MISPRFAAAWPLHSLPAMQSQLETLSAEQLVTATGGDFKGATFGALALLNASGLDTTPSNSVNKALQGPPPIVRILPSSGAPPISSGPKP